MPRRAPHPARAVLAALLCLVLATLAGCGRDEPAGQGGGKGGAAGDGALIGYSIPLGKDPAFQIMRQAIEGEAAARGRTVVTVDADLDPNKQISDIDTLLARGIKVLAVSPVDDRAVQGALERVRAKGIPIVVQESEGTGQYATNVMTSAEEASREAAAYLAKAIGKPGGKVAAVAGPVFAQVQKKRLAGFTAGAKAAGLQLVDTKFNNDFSRQTARAYVDAWRDRFGPAGVDGIWGFQDESALGAASARSAGFKPLVVGINGSPPAVAAVRAGELAATWDLLTVQYGQTVGWAANQALDHKPLPQTIWIPTRVVDKTNAAAWKPWEEQVRQPLGEPKFEQRDGKTFLVVP